MLKLKASANIGNECSPRGNYQLLMHTLSQVGDKLVTYCIALLITCIVGGLSSYLVYANHKLWGMLMFFAYAFAFIYNTFSTVYCLARSYSNFKNETYKFKPSLKDRLI